MSERDVLLYFPHPGTVRTEFLLSLLGALNHPDTRIAEMRELASGPALAAARNRMTRDFLKSPYEWLWMLDTDMVFTPHALSMLLREADPGLRPVIGGLCYVPAGDGKIPTTYKVTDAGGLMRFTPFEDWARGEVIQVDATGTACLLIHRSVFKRLTETDPESDGLWFAELAQDGRQFAEDFSFCIRCRDAGIPVHVHTGVRIGHVKPVMIGDAGP